MCNCGWVQGVPANDSWTLCNLIWINKAKGRKDMTLALYNQLHVESSNGNYILFVWMYNQFQGISIFTGEGLS